MNDTAIREVMDYEKQFTTNNELKSDIGNMNVPCVTLLRPFTAGKRLARNVVKRLVIKLRGRHSVRCFKNCCKKAGQKTSTASCRIMNIRRNYCKNII